MPAFRAAGPGDLDAILSLQRPYYAEDGYPHDEAAARAALARLLSDGSLGRVWVAVDGGAPVAYLVLTFGYSLEYRGRDAFIDEVFVAPSHRGRGLGGEALALAEAACVQAGVRALHLEVEREKAGAQALYRRHGFVDHDRYLMTRHFAEGR